MQKREIWKGSEAIAEAAIRAGCRCFFGYPITPQNEIPEYMSLRLPQGGAYLSRQSRNWPPSIWSTGLPPRVCGL